MKSATSLSAMESAWALEHVNQCAHIARGFGLWLGFGPAFGFGFRNIAIRNSCCWHYSGSSGALSLGLGLCLRFRTVFACYLGISVVGHTEVSGGRYLSVGCHYEGVGLGGDIFRWGRSL
jgi:hypothetical protein